MRDGGRARRGGGPGAETPWVREAVAIARQGRLMIRGLRGRPPRVVGERAVLFVHGFLATESVFDPLRRHVEAETGLPTVGFTWSPLASFESIAQRLAEHVDRTVPASTTVSLVGHSMGGLVARWFLQEHATAGRVDRLVTMATPHAGTESARRAPGPLAAALRPGSPVLRRLAEGRRRHCLPHTAVVAGLDRMCVPPSSAAALDDAEVHWFEDLGHNEMLFDERIFDLVAGLLR